MPRVGNDGRAALTLEGALGRDETRADCAERITA
jgi:hypothetical protein